MKNILLPYFILLSLLGSLTAQQQPLAVDPGQDQFEFCKQLYRQANSMRVQGEKILAYQRLVPRLNSYINRFPRHANTVAAQYYLGECYYHSGSIDDAKRVLMGVINRYKTGRYVALSSNRLAYDAYSNKNYERAAIHFQRLGRLGATAEERNRGTYQAASCYRYAGKPQKAIELYRQIESSANAGAAYLYNSKLRLGHLYKDGKQKEKALAKFEELIKPGVPGNIRIEATLNAGLIAMQLKKTEQAKRYLKVVLQSNEDKYKASAQVGLMHSLYTDKDYQGVLNVMRAGNHPGQAATEATKFNIAGRCALQLKNYHEAIKLFAQAERQIPLSAEAFEAGYYRLLSFFNIEGVNIPRQVDGFLEVYQPRYGKHQWIHKALLMKAETLFDQSKWREASGAYNQINSNIVGDANRAGLLYKRGWCLAESGDHNGAVRSLTDFITTYPNDTRIPTAVARRGKSYLALGDRAQALQDFDFLISKHPKEKLSALAWQYSARINKKDQNYAEMIRRYEAMLKNFPDLQKTTQANAYYWIGWGKYQLKQYEHAIAPLEKASELDAPTYAILGRMLIVYSAYSIKDKAKLQAAVETITKLGKGDKIQAPIYRWLGVQCYNGNSMKDAERFLTLGVTPLDPKQTPKAFWKLLGRARVETGKNERAIEALKNYLTSAEKPFLIAEAHLDLARAYLGLEKLAESETSATEGLKLRPQGKLNAELRMILGDISYARKDFPKAAAAYVVVCQLGVRDNVIRPDALFKAHKALLKKGDNKEAAVYLDTLNKEYPNFLKK